MRLTSPAAGSNAAARSFRFAASSTPSTQTRLALQATAGWASVAATTVRRLFTNASVLVDGAIRRATSSSRATRASRTLASRWTMGASSAGLGRGRASTRTADRKGIRRRSNNDFSKRTALSLDSPTFPPQSIGAIVLSARDLAPRRPSRAGRGGPSYSRPCSTAPRRIPTRSARRAAR